MNYIFDQHIDRRNSDSKKWNAYGDDVIPLWVADMDFRAPEPVINALENRMRHGVFGYSKEINELKDTIVERMDILYQWKINTEDILFLPGVVPGFNLACRSFLESGESVIMQTPVYPPFLKAPTNSHLNRIENELTLDSMDNYSIDFDDFEQKFERSTKLFILCNPHNPVGRVFNKYELEKFAGICLQHRAIICSDEIHCDLVFSGHKHIPIAALDPEIAQNSITLMAPSKTYNIAGLKCSYIIAQNPKLREKLLYHMQAITGSVNLFGYTAAQAAYKDGQPWLDELLKYLEGNRDYLLDYVKRKIPGIKITKPEGTFLAWLDCNQIVSITKNPYEFFLTHAQVALNDGQAFGKPGKGFVRLNFGCPKSLLEEALERMSNSLS